MMKNKEQAEESFNSLADKRKREESLMIPFI